MGTEYYAKVDLQKGKYYMLICVADSGGYGLIKGAAQWQSYPAGIEACWDTCCDLLTEKEAAKLAKAWGVKKTAFNSLPVSENKASKIAIYIGTIPDESRDTWLVPFFDADLALENRVYCGSTDSRSLAVLDKLLWDKYQIDSSSGCWLASREDLKNLFKQLKLKKKPLAKLEGDVEYGVQYFGRA